MRNEMRKIGLLIFIGWLISSSFAIGQEIYQWVDEKGTLYFTDNLSLVPEKYRNQVQKKRPPKEPSPPLSPQVSKEEEMEEKPGSAPERRDLIGGERNGGGPRQRSGMENFSTPRKIMKPLMRTLRKRRRNWRSQNSNPRAFNGS